MNTAKIELHLHLDGSVDLPWAYRKSLERKVIPEHWGFADYYDYIYKDDYDDQEAGFAKFDIPLMVMQHYEDLMEGTYLVVKNLADKGIIYAEIRFASQLHTLKGMSQHDAIKAVIEGANQAMRDFPGIRVGIINAFMHRGKDAFFNEKENMETIEASKDFYGKGLVAMDLAGYENTGDFMNYAPLFKKAKEYGIPYTIHAGEMGEGRHVLDAIEMGASRIGHGIDAIQDEVYMKALEEHHIPLEICLTSNCGSGPTYANHPIHQLMKRDITITLSSDNMMFARNDLAYEHAMARAVGISEEKLKEFTWNAAKCAFCDEETRQWIMKQL